MLYIFTIDVSFDPVKLSVFHTVQTTNFDMFG